MNTEIPAWLPFFYAFPWFCVLVALAWMMFDDPYDIKNKKKHEK